MGNVRGFEWLVVFVGAMVLVLVVVGVTLYVAVRSGTRRRGPHHEPGLVTETSAALAAGGGGRSQAGRPGVDVPDARGRTGLHLTGRDLSGNDRVVVRDVELVASPWHVLRRTTFDYRNPDGTWTTQVRETYDRGNGATILLHDVARGTVLLSRQFRFPVYVNGHPDGMLVETAAGLLDDDDPVTAIRREAQEELGVRVGEVTHVYDVFMSPGSVTERLHFFAAPYTPGDRVTTGGGVAVEGEDIEVLELPFAEALAMVRDGRIVDGKTIMLLHWAALEGPFAGPRG